MSSTASNSDRPALGSRDNHYWDDHDDGDPRGGHSECRGTDAAEFVAHQLALQIVAPVCGETGRELSEPKLYLPKQEDIGCGNTREFRQHRQRRRYEPESGRINWGETTSTDVPEFDYDVFQTAVHTYLASRECRLTDVDEYLEHAETVWHDPTMGSKDSLAQFVRYVREQED
jgi:hypothetical protein